MSFIFTIYVILLLKQNCDIRIRKGIYNYNKYLNLKYQVLKKQ